MGWLWLALLTGALVALRDALVKRGGGRADEYETILIVSTTTAVVLSLVLAFTGLPRVGPRLPLAILGSAVPGLFAYVLLVRAVRQSDLSLVAPLLGVTPLFLLFTTPLILGERPDANGVAGVVLIVLGAYLLNLGDIRQGPLEPFRALLRDRGARSMLGVALLWSISANYDKIGVEATSAVAWPVVVHSFVALMLGPFVFWRRGRASRIGAPSVEGDEREASPDRPLSTAEGHWRAPISAALLLAGLANSVAAVAQMTALTLTVVPYVIAVKRTSLLFSVVLGRIMFDERRIRERALGASVILIGVIVFALGHA